MRLSRIDQATKRRAFSYGAASVLALRPLRCAVVDVNALRRLPMGQQGIAQDWVNVGGALFRAVRWSSPKESPGSCG